MDCIASVLDTRYGTVPEVGEVFFTDRLRYEWRRFYRGFYTASERTQMRSWQNGVWSEALNKVNAQPRTNSTSLIAARVYMCFHRYRPSSQVGPSFGPQAHSPQATWTGEHSSSLVVHHCAGRSLLCSGLRSSLHSRSQTLLSVESLPLPLVEGSPLLIPACIY